MTRHRTDVLSLVAGLLFLGIAAAALADLLNWRTLDADWLVPAVLVGAGLALLAGATRDGRDGDGPATGDTGWEVTDTDG